MESTIGMMGKSIEVSGWTIGCRVRVSSYGQMVGSIVVISKRTREMDMESMIIRISPSIMVIGRMVSNMDKASIYSQMEESRKDYGMKAKESNLIIIEYLILLSLINILWLLL